MPSLIEYASDGMEDKSLDDFQLATNITSKSTHSTWANKPREMSSGDEVVMATARASDLTGGTRYRQVEKMQLVMRYRKWVAVAASRNADAVAACVPRVMRVAPAKGGMLRGVRLSDIQCKRVREGAGRVAQKTFGSYKEGWEEITDDRHPLVKILGRANSNVNGFELVGGTQLFLEMTGDGYWSKVYTTERYPTELYNLFPQYAEIRPNADGSIRDYNYGRPEKKIPLDPKSVVHFKFPNPFDPFYGLAPLARCVQEADLSEELTVFARAFLDNGAVGGTNVFIESAMNADQMAQVKNEWDAKNAGARHANNVRILRGKGVRIEYPPQLDKNPILTQSEIDARNIIAACFDIPVGLLNMEERSLANGKVVAPHWQLLSIRPRVQRMEDKINEDLVPEFREALNDPTLLVVFDNPVDEDREAMVMEVTQLAGGKPLITQDEGRAKLGMPPLTPAQKEELAPPEPADEWGGVGAGGGKDNGSDSQSKALWAGDHHHDGDESKTLPKGAKEVGRAMAALLTRIFRSYAPKYAQDAASESMGVSANLTRQMAMEVFEAVEAPIARLALFGYNSGVADVNEQADYDMAQREAFAQPAVEYLGTYRLKLANAVTQTYEGRVRALVSGGLEDGATPSEIAQMVRSTIPNEAPYAADRIARTETARALNAGKDLAYKESGIVTEREWLLSGNPCKVCREIHAKFRFAPVGEPFVPAGTKVAGRIMDYNGGCWGGDGHPNCSCGTSAVIDRSARA